jgi:hypothetical protein
MEIEVAAYGWQGEEWKLFYPQDLPDDWRLDYYANEFFAAVVPYSEWSLVEEGELLEWQEQVSDDFRFYWELPGDEADGAARLQRLLGEEPFAAHFGGVVAPGGETPGAQSPFSEERLSQLVLTESQELRPLRETMEQAMGDAREAGSARLVVVVQPAAAASLRSARDLAQLLGGG